MTNNYILRRLRYTFDFNDKTMIAIWAQADETVTREQISDWLKQEEDPEYKNCNDRLMAVFLNGLINKFRGKKDGPQMAPETRINNNIILRKLKIALNLIDDDILAILASVEMDLGKSELSAFFRKAGHKHHRKLQDQMLRRFLQGVEMKYKKIDATVTSEKAEALKPEVEVEVKESVNSGVWKVPKSE